MTPAPTIAFSTLGCRLNQVDTRQLQAQLEAAASGRCRSARGPTSSS